LILLDERKLVRPSRTLLIATAGQEEATLSLPLICRDSDVNDTRRGAYRKLLSQTYIHEELGLASIKEDTKAVEKLVDLLENVFNSPWKQ